MVALSQETSAISKKKNEKKPQGLKLQFVGLSFTKKKRYYRAIAGYFPKFLKILKKFG